MQNMRRAEYGKIWNKEKCSFMDQDQAPVESGIISMCGFRSE
jgi:hypothetical protein